ncbi:LuxR C-terminal-related transcriptional regulator [Spongiactinospora sp. TRM90649]|uniref:LuxR C-terminal-related transcriptional regulator n=1 Tax=Spongiactinospora sp. TRM90649 TaxID=3031114 RepID=UPI0023F8F965|nr:LuxR C-terminal-related transcriptional regulator [Spongiactinospora sp. TRM90649]MDF5756913.1 LuxR C-terminal-related transcriptional regulator [Spongiactinospora sp. TRM90649]
MAALDGVIPGLAGQRADLGHQDVEGVVLPRLLNAIAARPEPAVLVLDDFHVIQDQECRRQVETLVDRLPPTFQLVVISRAVPALPLTRYRASGDSLELGMADLRFTREEATRLVRRIAGVHLREADVRDLIARTEGWPAAISLAAGALRTAADPAAFVADFTGTHRLVLDYLSEEVLSRVPAATRTFLTRVSTLGSFTAPLCDEVAETTDAAEVLGELERANLFLVPLDDHRRWYRFHRLFGEALRGELARTEPGAVPALHLRASGWLSTRGLVDEAIGHALAADRADLAAGLFAARWGEYIDSGRLLTVRGWMELIGAQRIGGDPRISVCAAWIAALSGDRPGTRHWLDVAEALPYDGPLPDGSPSARFALSLLRAFFGFDGVPAMVAAAETAARLEPDPLGAWYAGARFTLGYSRYLTGDLEAAIEPLEEAAQHTTTVPAFRTLATSVLSLVLGALGRTTQAAQLARTAYRLVETRGLPESGTAALADAAWGAALAREGRHAEARLVLEPALALRLTVVGLSAWPTLILLIVLADSALGSGDAETARAFLGQARDLVATERDCGEYIRTRLTQLRVRLPETPAASGAAEPLTQREQAVLRLLRGDSSLREIGHQLFVSTNTVKTHTRSIYRKLGATSRDHAVRRARELGLL